MPKVKKSIFKEAEPKKEENAPHHNHHEHGHHHHQHAVSVHNDVNINMQQQPADKSDDGVTGCFKEIFKCFK